MTGLETLRGLLPDSEIKAATALLDEVTEASSTPRKWRRYLRDLDRREAEVQAIVEADRRLTGGRP